MASGNKQDPTLFARPTLGAELADLTTTVSDEDLLGMLVAVSDETGYELSEADAESFRTSYSGYEEITLGVEAVLGVYYRLSHEGHVSVVLEGDAANETYGGEVSQA